MSASLRKDDLRAATRARPLGGRNSSRSVETNNVKYFYRKHVFLPIEAIRAIPPLEKMIRVGGGSVVAILALRHYANLHLIKNLDQNNVGGVRLVAWRRDGSEYPLTLNEAKFDRFGDKERMYIHLTPETHALLMEFAFNTPVSSVVAAAILHYQDYMQQVKDGALILLDYGYGAKGRVGYNLWENVNALTPSIKLLQE